MDPRRLCVIYFAFLLSDCIAAYDVIPRWGQATVVVGDAVYVHGGKTDVFNEYSYSSAPNNNDILYLSLSSPFEATEPPWQLVSSASNPSTPRGPAVSWHTLSAFNTSEILLFGGQPGPNSPTVLVGEADSAYILNIYQGLEHRWLPEVASWAGQPTRRIYHSSTTAVSGRVFIIGGEKADGSNNGFSDHYVFDSTGPSFTLLPIDNSPPDLTGHKSIILADGRLLVLGGYSHSQGLLNPFTVIWAIDVTKQNAGWTLLNVSQSPLPPPRRAFVAVLLADGKVLIHGGSDAILQNNLGDGWILDTSQTPMVWSEINVLSQLGARRDHFAISYGNQVLFGFGYDNTGPAPAALHIFDVSKGSFTSTFTPLPHTSMPTPTLPGLPQPSKSGHTGTGSHGPVSPTSTLNPNPGDPNNGGGDGHPDDDDHRKTTAIAVGTVFGVVGLLVVGIVGVYYFRRRHAGGHKQFMALRTGEGDDDDQNSLHVAGGIPVAVHHTGDEREFGHGWSFGVLNSISLAGVIGSPTTFRNIRPVPGRRDMLADEDTRYFGEWYDARRRDGTGGSSWSLRSILTTRMRGREASTGTTGGASWKEKENPFSDGTALMKDEETGYIGATSTGRPPGRRQMSYASTRSSRSYVDPFADPTQEEIIDFDTDVQTRLPQPLPALRTSLPISMGVHILTPLPERASQNTLSTNDPATSSSSHFEHPNSPFDTTSSHITSRTSLEPPYSPKPLAPSIVGSSLPAGQAMRRSDTWWSRFSRTSFLDRRTSDVSRRSAKMPEIRDPNPPPRLGPIQESIHSMSPGPNSSKSRSDSSEQYKSVSRKTSNVYGTHNKSLTSVRTADTEAIERMAGTMDVVQRIRTGSHRTTRSTSTADMSVDTYTNSRGQTPEQMEDIIEYELSILAPPVEMSHAEVITTPKIKPLPNEEKSSPPLSPPLHPPIMDGNRKLNAEGAVAAQIHAYERRTSEDQEMPSPTNTKKWEERARRKNISVNYGLVQRPSLYVANPDHRMTSSGDS